MNIVLSAAVEFDVSASCCKRSGSISSPSVLSVDGSLGSLEDSGSGSFCSTFE